MSTTTQKKEFLQVPKKKRESFSSQAGISRSPTFSKRSTDSTHKLESGDELIRALWARMQQLNLTPKQVAEDHLGMTYAYLTALHRGDRSTKSIGNDTLRKMAEFLGLPPAQAWLLAGVLSNTDFLFQEDIENRVQSVYEKMRADPIWCGYVVNEEIWNATPLEMKVSFCFMYERACQTVMLDKETVDDVLNNGEPIVIPAGKKTAAA